MAVSPFLASTELAVIGTGNFHAQRRASTFSLRESAHGRVYSAATFADTAPQETVIPMGNARQGLKRVLAEGMAGGGLGKYASGPFAGAGKYAWK